MTDMLAMIRSLGDQLRWAAELTPVEVPPPGSILFTGMGGSGIAGDYTAALNHGAGSLLATHKGYPPLPGWALSTRPLVVAISYSGNTEETLEVARAAAKEGLAVAAITTGGRLGELAEEGNWPVVRVPSDLQPRAALGYLFGAAARLAGWAGAAPDPAPALKEAAMVADAATSEDGPVWSEAMRIGEALAGRLTIVYGSGPVSGTAAQRWKTQINENAKSPAWYSLLPELDHNEIVGWEAIPERTAGSVAVVALTDRDDHPRVGVRLDHTVRLTEDAVPWAGRVASWGESAVARLISLTAVGDLVSWALAVRLGVDPVPVQTIEKLKQLLKDGR